MAIREGRALDLIEIDAASNRGIDAIRELRERINYAPTDLKRKVYILDEAHQITKDAWNALLKSLEEPPDFVVFMFASTHPQDFPPAILSRLQRFDVRRLAPAEIEGKLARILEGDGRQAEPEALRLIARLAAGGMRDAESMLDQLLASGGERLDEATVRDLLGLAPADAISGYVAAMLSGDIGAGVRILDELEDRGRDLRAFLEQLVDVVRSGLVGGASGDAAGEAVEVAVADMVRLARRLGGIDPNRAGIGGLRLQLELALFPDPADASRPGPCPRRLLASCQRRAGPSWPRPSRRPNRARAPSPTVPRRWRKPDPDARGASDDAVRPDARRPAAAPAAAVPAAAPPPPGRTPPQRPLLAPTGDRRRPPRRRGRPRSHPHPPTSPTSTASGSDGPKSSLASAPTRPRSRSSRSASRSASRTAS